MMADVEFEPLHGENEEEAEFILEKRSGQLSIILLTKPFLPIFTIRKNSSYLVYTGHFLEKDSNLKLKLALLHSEFKDIYSMVTTFKS